MFVTIGYFSLWIALVLTFFEITFPFILLIKKNCRFKSKIWGIQKYFFAISYSQTFFLGLAIFILLIALLINDTQFAYVFQYSNVNLPTLFKIGALWGNNSGAILLWIFLYSIWKSSIVFFNKSIPNKILMISLSVLGIIAFIFIVYMIIFFNPFHSMSPSQNMVKFGLNPLLQDFGLGIHPPLLYAGILGFSIPFALAISILITGKWDIIVSKIIRKYTLVSFTILSAGIIIGGWWSYRVLGWGGWWGWDPVENLSLFPWLVGLSLIHALYISNRYQAFKIWSLFLALLSFSMSLFGTIIIRSGLLISSHAFVKNISVANTFLMTSLFLIMGCVLILFIIKAWSIKSKTFIKFPIALLYVLFSSIVVFLLMLTVALGTFYPIIMDVLNAGKISVGAPYFNLMIMVFSIPCLLVLTIMTFNKIFNTFKSLKTGIAYGFLLLISLMITFIIYLMIDFSAIGFIINLFAISLMMASLILLYKRIFISKSIKHLGSVISHFGIAILVFGIINNTTGIIKNVEMHVGDSIKIQNKLLILKKIQIRKENNYVALFAIFSYDKDLIIPSIRYYSAQKYLKSVPYIKSKWLGDVYVSLGRPVSSKIWAVQILTKPFIHVIWFGSFIVILGILFSFINLFSRKKFIYKKDHQYD